VLRHTSPDDLSIEEFPFYIYQTRDISCRSLQCIPANKQTNIIRPTYCKSLDHWNHLQLGCILNRTCKLTVIHSFVTCSLLYIPQDFPLFVIIFLTFPQQQVMAPQTPQLGVIQSELSRTTGTSSNAPLAETQLQRRHQIVHRDAAIAATENMAQDAHLKKVRKTGRSNNRQQHAIGCE